MILDLANRYVVKSKIKGVKVERELANKLWSLGFAVVRSGSSGGGVRKRFAPDIVAMKNGKILVLEVKYRSKEESISISVDRLLKLLDFSRRAGGYAYVAVKYSGSQWRFIDVKELVKDNDGHIDSRYVTLHPEVVKKGLSLRQLVERLLCDKLSIG